MMLQCKSVSLYAFECQHRCWSTCAMCFIGVFTHIAYFCCTICTVDSDILLCWVVSRLTCVMLKSVSWTWTTLHYCSPTSQRLEPWGRPGITPSGYSVPSVGSSSPLAGRLVSCQLPWRAHASLLVTRPLIWGGCESLTSWSLAALLVSSRVGLCPWFLPLCLRLGGIKRLAFWSTNT